MCVCFPLNDFFAVPVEEQRGELSITQNSRLSSRLLRHSALSDLNKSVRYMCADTSAHQLRRYDLPLLLVLPKMIKRLPVIQRKKGPRRRGTRLSRRRRRRICPSSRVSWAAASKTATAQLAKPRHSGGPHVCGCVLVNVVSELR